MKKIGIIERKDIAEKTKAWFENNESGIFRAATSLTINNIILALNELGFLSAYQAHTGDGLFPVLNIECCHREWDKETLKNGQPVYICRSPIGPTPGVECAEGYCPSGYKPRDLVFEA